ncbi:MAG: hypothetical protein LBU32_22785 [Clostridiales bacterium]|nr:hypothetical protein [Clostridiales bacterium]
MRKGCKNPMLNIHHIETGKIGGGAPNNPAALCGDCHSDYRDAHGNRGAESGAMRES